MVAETEATIPKAAWDTLRAAGLEESVRREAEAFRAECAQILLPYAGREQAERIARGMSAAVPIAHCTAHVARHAESMRRDLRTNLAIHLELAPTEDARAKLNHLFDRVERIVSATPEERESCK